jgi:hypothetical protein
MKGQRDAVVSSALSDPAPGVVQMAALAVGRQDMQDVLPKLVDRLQDNEHQFE